MKTTVFIVIITLILVSCGPTPEKPEKLKKAIEETEAVLLTATETSTQTLIASTSTPEATISLANTVESTTQMIAKPTDTLAPISTDAQVFIPTETPAPIPTDTLVNLPTKTTAPTPTESITFLNSCIPGNSQIERATVTNIVDGDTIEVMMDGKQYRVRYIGIDTPERERPLYEEARKANADLVLNKEVSLIKDVSETDSFDRLLRYTYVGDIFVNMEMVKLGLAVAEDYPPDTACSSTLSTTMNTSRSSQIGLWAATPVPEPSAPIIVIVSVDKKSEYVDIQNQGTSDVVLSGWNLVSEKGKQDCPLSGLLKPGETLRIWAMNSQGEGYSCGYSKNIWNNSEPDPAVLYNPEGVEVSRK